ncbi:hypothetical protein SDC9_93629 [bioreactor metagenome]|uniref:Uncharacterized protein n=1 Tax=bioreactor metagenome TaxID=1076179 RepID=A0A645A1K6_9ZZZZ
MDILAGIIDNTQQRQHDLNLCLLKIAGVNLGVDRNISLPERFQQDTGLPFC